MTGAIYRCVRKETVVWMGENGEDCPRDGECQVLSEDGREWTAVAWVYCPEGNPMPGGNESYWLNPVTGATIDGGCASPNK